MGLTNPAGAAPRIASGQYTGDDADNRQIVTGWQCSMVIIKRAANATQSAMMLAGESWKLNDLTTLAGGSGLHATDGFIVYTTGDSLNHVGVTYNYWAISG